MLFRSKVLASMLEEGKPLSDKQSAIGNIAANYPEIARTENLPTMVPRVTRAGAAGSLGAALGWTTMGYPGAIAGGIAGAALGEASRLGILSRMRDPRFQVMNALPPDYRIPLNELAAQRGPMANVPVPYDWQQNINVGQPGYQPNWVYGQIGRAHV